MPYGAWRSWQKNRRRAEEIAYSLPEVKAFGRMIERLSKGSAHWISWVESAPSAGCEEGSPECAWQFYVGEDYGTHSVRRQTLLVDSTSLAVSVLDIAGNRQPYSSWSAEIRARLRGQPEFARIGAKRR